MPTLRSKSQETAIAGDLMMNVDWLNLYPDTITHPGMWDDTWLRELLNGDFGPVPDFGNVVVIPGRYHDDDIDRINRYLNRYLAVLVIITADEESRFPADELHHENMIVWVQTQRPGRYEKSFTSFPLGYPPETREMLQEAGPQVRAVDPFWFAGQVTHLRREQAVAAMRELDPRLVVETAGFTQGLDRLEFIEQLAYTKTAPCPSGPETQECFRMWEAIAAGSIPILDLESPRGNDGYWDKLFGISLPGTKLPLPIIADWSKIGDLITDLVAGWPHTSNRVQAWYSQYRAMWAKALTVVLTTLEPPAKLQVHADSQVTVLIPTSPSPFHPDTAHVEETILSVRERFPHSPIRIMIDGVRPEQWERIPDYHEYTRRLLWLVNNQWWNVQATLHDVHRHQAQMTFIEMVSVETPLLLFVEHDTPLFGDWPIGGLVQPLLAGHADLIRLNHDYRIHPEHEYLMVDEPEKLVGGLSFRKTIQWSQRPHLARVGRYQEWLAEHFDFDERSMIEDRMHSVVQSAHYWGQYKLYIYTPEGNQQRSIHLDSRGDDPKWPVTR
ncbi:MAG: hypothetical protein GY906_10050 [bacterium]|nr:hypothetical protein [bacterium]